MEGGSGGNDRELWTKTLQIEHKLFYFDLKQNPRGQYLKISEKTSATRSTIIVPAQDIHWFLDLFNYYIGTDDREVCSKELTLDTKVYYFDDGKNKRGRFLKISEASVNRNRSTIIVPAGSSGVEEWAKFRSVLQEVYEASETFAVSSEQHMEPSEHLPGLSDDVGAGFISSHIAQPVSGSDLNVNRLAELHLQDESGSIGLPNYIRADPNYIRADQKRFYFDLGRNNRGHYLKISEVAGTDRSCIILPLSGLKEFHERIGHIVEITKDEVEGMTSANVRTVDPA